MRRGGAGRIAANPVLVGAVTTLVIVVAVFLAYNANSGLPFVPTYDLKVRVDNAANLVEGNDVRVGGTRVGAVTKIKPVLLDDGKVIAELTLKLETKVDPLKSDTSVIIRSRSALGLKYVEITPGTRGENIPNGGRLALSRATPEPVELDEVVSLFDEPTRDANAEVLGETGTGLAGRGISLGRSLRALEPVLRRAIPVFHDLTLRETRLRNLFPALGRTASTVAPLAETQAKLVRELDSTFGALQVVARPELQDSIEETPPTLDTAIRTLPRQRAFLGNVSGLMRDLRPGTRALRTSAPTLSRAITVGTPTLRALPQLNRRLEPLLRSVERFATDPQVPLGVDRLFRTATAANPLIAHLKPIQTVCNYVTLWFRNVASLLSEGDANGTWQRFIIVAGPQGPNSESLFTASKPANGPTADNHLHVNPYPNTASPGQPRECEGGNEPYAVGETVLSNTPGNQGVSTERTREGGQ